MQRKNISFEQLSDIMAFRIIVKTVADCYHALGVIHGLYPTVPGRFKDYISLPKPNGYRSLHTTVIGPENHRIEVQIRTTEMQEEAELGVAAHWSYKQTDGKTDGRQFRWLRELMDIVEQAQRPEEFLENTKLELYQDQVFCFTPSGDLIALPRGATPVDFAYAVHSDLGDKTVGCKINGRIVPLNTQLANGDQIEITTSKNQTPSPHWERFVVTGKAKARIRRFIRLQQREQYMALGKSMLQKVLKQEGFDLNEKQITQDICRDFKTENVEDLLTGIGSGNVPGREVFYALHPEYKPREAPPTVQSIVQGEKKPHAKGKAAPMPIKGLIPGMALHFARCCHPLPGDRIVGIVTTGKGVTVHTVDCDTLESFADTPERWLDVSWEDGDDSPESHVGRLIITISNTPGALGTLSTVIGKNQGNITNLKIMNRSLDFWDMMIDVHVRDSRHLSDIIAALRSTPEVTAVNRARSR
jgi:GTP pyrophosphokinase